MLTVWSVSEFTSVSHVMIPVSNSHIVPTCLICLNKQTNQKHVVSELESSGMASVNARFIYFCYVFRRNMPFQLHRISLADKTIFSDMCRIHFYGDQKHRIGD